MKQFVISHIKDVDGVSPIMMMKLWKKEFEYKLLDVHEVETFMMEFLERDFSEYDHIYIVDLSVPENIYEKIEKSDIRNKIQIFDHHKTHEYAKKYPYVTLDIEECGTTLFYQYLLTQGLINSGALQEYVESVKHLDLWTFEEENDTLAPQLGILFELYGEKRYIQELVKNLSQKKEHFSFSTFEKKILKLEEENQKRYIDKRELRMIFAKICGYQAGIVFAEKYRSELGNVLLKRHSELDFIAIINLNGGISLRSREVDISKIALRYGGGGHPLASGIGISKQVQEEILKLIWKGEISFENNESDCWPN